MIPVANPIPEPEEMQQVRQKGLAFLQSLDAEGIKPLTAHWKGKDFWLSVKPQLRSAFSNRCAYLAMRENGEGEVDHFISKNEDPTQAYNWNNYRFASNEVNKRKLNRKSEQFLDPFLVQENWFEVDLVSGKVLPTDEIPDALRQKTEDTIEMLGLNKDSYKETRLEYSSGCLK